MSYSLSATTIKAPASIEESNSTQFAQQRTLSGAINRDFFGSNKRTWTLEYKNTNQADYTTINNIYQTYLSTGTTVNFASTETNYTVAATAVHVDLQVRKFGVGGSDYISDFTLILTED